MHTVRLAPFSIGPSCPLTLLAGPCVIETEELALSTAHTLQTMCSSLGIQLVYKSSYDKANRSSIHSFRGVGIDKGLAILQKVKKDVGVPIVTDIHSPEEAPMAASVCDILQIPAFLCRQTDLILAAAQTGSAINVKKGQFMAPWDMKNVVDKIESTGNNKIILTDRGTSFGYNNLVSDMRCIPIMQSFGYPVCFDATHSVQLPGGHGASSGGQRTFIPTLTKAAIAAGCHVLFLETHPHPHLAKSDKDTVIPLDRLSSFLQHVVDLYRLIQSQEHLCFDIP